MDITLKTLMKMNMEEVFWATAPSFQQVERAIDLWHIYTEAIPEDSNFMLEMSKRETEIAGEALGRPTMQVRLYLAGCKTSWHSPEFLAMSSKMPDSQGIRFGDNILILDVPQSMAYAKLVRRKLAANGHPMYEPILETLESMISDTKHEFKRKSAFDDEDPQLHIRISQFLPKCYHGWGNSPSVKAMTQGTVNMLYCSNSGVPEDNHIPAKDVPMYSLRELCRIAHNEYTPMPEHIIDRIDPKVMIKEVPHLAIKGANRGKIAYTENARKGVDDIQSIMKPGKYLRRVLKDSMSDKELKEAVAELYGAATFDIKVTTDPKVAKQVYVDGPSSCMSKGSEQFDTEDDNGEWRHPIEALFDYDNDIALVYVMNGDRPCARALLNTEDLTYPAMYIADWSPNAKSILDDWLRTEGYSRCDEALHGQPIAKIEVGRDRYLCPYIDSGNLGVRFESDHLMIGGPFAADYRDGWVSEEDPEDVRECEACSERRHMDDMRSAEWDDEWYCDNCYNDIFVSAITECGTDVVDMPLDRTIELPGFATVHGCRLDRVHEDIDNHGLSHIGFIRLDSDGDIYDIDECYCTEDTIEWVHIDDVFGPNDEPSLNRAHDSRSYAVNEHDGCVYERDDMIWDVEDGQWRHEDDIPDTDRVKKAGNGIRFLPPETEDDQDAA